MQPIYAIHAPYDAAKLATITAEMAVLGAPTIQVVDCGDYYMALEGSHRLAAAAQLGISPLLAIHSQDEIIDVTAHDWYDATNWAGTHYSAGEVAGELYSVHAVPYTYA